MPDPGGSTCGGSSTASQGNSSGTNTGAGNPIDITTGNKYQREVDLPALPGVLGLEIVRHYNSMTSGFDAKTGIFGRGWKLSYESELFVDGDDALRVVQADGAVIVFHKERTAAAKGRAKDARPVDGTAWVSADPQQGRLDVLRNADGKQYRWRWGGAGGLESAGRELLFDGEGRLLQISAPTGEFVTLQRDRDGMLLRVTDPQGRSLLLNYLDKKSAQADRDNNQRFRGVQSIDSPVGRFTYAYNDFGQQTPENVRREMARRHVDPVTLLPNLVKVALPTHHEPDTKAHPYANRGLSSSTVSRFYHYENVAFPTLLTGITVSGQGSDGVQMHQRISTYLYDEKGRANLSVRGEPARLQLDANGKPSLPWRLVEGTGIEQVTLERPSPNVVVLTNALGQQTRYLTAKINGQMRILEARGAGCSSCGPANVRYAYDEAGRLAETTTLASNGVAVNGDRTERDAQGRTTRLGHVAYVDGKAQAPDWLRRYEYGDDPAQVLPLVVAEPSFATNREHLFKISYNAAGQVSELSESGFSQIDPQGHPNRDGAPINRTFVNTYRRINGRSLIATGGRPESPSSFVWDSAGNFVVRVRGPGGLETGESRDPTTGQLTSRTDPSGVVTRYVYEAAAVTLPSRIERGGQASVYRFDALRRVSGISAVPTGTDGEGSARTISLRYDAAGRLVAATDAQGYKAQVNLDAEGQPLVAGLYEPGGAQPLRATYRWYDTQRRLSKELRADGRLDVWRYDSAGNVSEHVDGDEVMHLDRRNAQGLRARVAITPDGLVKASLSSEAANDRPSLAMPRVEHDDFGRPVLQWRPEQGLRIRIFDADDRLRREDRIDLAAKPAGHVEQEYDAAGRLLKRLSFDAAGRLVETVERGYEGARLKSERNDAQRTDYAFDESGRIIATTISLTNEAGEVVYKTTLRTTYGASGEPATKTLADGSLMRIERNHATAVPERISLQSAFWAGVADRIRRTLPEAAARSLARSLPSTAVVNDVVFDPYNGITAFTQGNGIRTEREFDRAGRLTRTTIGTPDVVLARASYRYDVGPKIRGLAEQGAGQAPRKASYEYDGFGTLLEASQPQLIKTAFTDPQGLPQRAQRQFDLRGRLENDGSFSYTYNENDQLADVGQAGRTIARYRYNALAQRVSKSVSGTEGQTTTYFLWAEGKLVAEIDVRDKSARLQAQYLYLSDGGKAAPIAKIETAEAAGNGSGHDRVLYVHCDYRGAPIRMTDGGQHVLWNATPDDWGFVRARSSTADAARMDLRLPGQYFDAETGLHDNWHRTYDARPQSVSAGSGAYLTPDPLGYPSGDMDSYRYVHGDPVNFTDPMGLYQTDIHFYMTYFLAVSAGMKPEDAFTLASGTQYVDNNPNTEPINWFYIPTPDQATRLRKYHFVMWKFDNNPNAGETQIWDTSPSLANAVGRSAPLGSLLGYAIPTVPEGVCPAPNEKSLQFMGEFLHAFEDSYAHRDQFNVPVKVNYGFGHAYLGENPDYTYDHSNPIYDPNTGMQVASDVWNVNEPRTLQMEKDTYAQIVAYMQKENYYASGQATSTRLSLAELDSTLKTFNHIAEKDGNTSKFTTHSVKLDTLNAFLASKNLGSLPRYDAHTACTKRQANLNGLSQTDYPSAILATPTSC